MVLAGIYVILIVAFAIRIALHPSKPIISKHRSPGKTVEQVCGSCHGVPSPDILSRESWPPAISGMMKIARETGFPFTHGQLGEVFEYYQTNSPEELQVLSHHLAPSGLQFKSRALGTPAPESKPRICNVNIVDLDQNSRPDILVCDADLNSVSWFHDNNGTWEEKPLASQLIAPAHTEVLDCDSDGDLDIVVAVLGHLMPSDALVGKVVCLINDGESKFTPRTILQGVPRVADVQPGDFDQDGDLDYVVAMFGWRKSGEIGWLEQLSNGTFKRHTISKKHGAIHVLPVDLNQDGRLDFVALFSQEYEEVVAFLNQGEGRFDPHPLYQADNPLFGSSGIELVDLDQDGDLDILYTNGDALDRDDPSPKPYHGIQWLENRGSLKFVYHDVARFYGVYRAVAGDLDNDGDLDIVAASLFNQWDDQIRQSLIWLENDGSHHFTPRAITNRPSHLVTVDLGDLNGDGLIDIVAGGMHVFPPFDRVGRVTLWTNFGKLKD